MRVTRLDLDGTGSPLGLVAKILEAEPDLPIPVPIEELAMSLDIGEIAELNTEGFDGGLVTDEARSFGGILVRKAMDRRRRRFTIGHELGHFLIPTHTLPATGQFLCSSLDMRRWSAKAQDRAARMEAEANKFSAGILMPAPHLRPLLGKGKGPDLNRILSIHEHFDVSREAAARSYVNYHGGILALVVIQRARILRIYRSASFPRTCVSAGSPIPDHTKSGLGGIAQGSVSQIRRGRSEDWLESDWGVRMPRLYEQVMVQGDEFAMVLLHCVHDEELDDDFDPDADKTSKQRYLDRLAGDVPFSYRFNR